MNFVDLPRNNTKIDEKLDFVETKRETNNQDLLFNIIEKQAKEFEEFGKRMSLELHTSYQDFIKQQNELKFQKFYSGVEPGVTCCECKEKTKLINSLKARIQELENDSKIKNQSIKTLQKDVQSLFDIIVKKGKTNIENPDIVPAKITITTAVEEEIKIDNVEVKEIEKNRLSVESFQYNDDIKDCYSDSAIDLFTDDEDDTSTTAGSVRSEDSDYHKPSEWLDVSPTLTQRAKIDKRNLDRWNSKMASNGLIPIRLVGKVDTEREKKYQTHRKRYSTSAIWLKTYENKQNQNQNQNQKQNKDEKFKIPSFGFTFNTTEDTKKKEKEFPDPISLKSSVSTSVSELSTTSLATTSLQSYEILSKEHQKNSFNSKSQQILSQYK